ncbi:hypothetical protein GJ744_007956 [Endocarpon pusillum]|uniref:Uncharacterized protein n=1 Tax=Endocarpon pusillum TaxID=364733 RepID=A0A8H7AM90_9EURO|nr:hypothetical protein GJ744_007956 [Endocarpon pusillum]
MLLLAQPTGRRDLLTNVARCSGYAETWTQAQWPSAAYPLDGAPTMVIDAFRGSPPAPQERNTARAVLEVGG